MKTVEEIEEKASEYVDSVRNRINPYALDLYVEEAFQKGAEWMQEQIKKPYNQALEDLLLAIREADLKDDVDELVEKLKK